MLACASKEIFCSHDKVHLLCLEGAGELQKCIPSAKVIRRSSCVQSAQRGGISFMCLIAHLFLEGGRRHLLTQTAAWTASWSFCSQLKYSIWHGQIYPTLVYGLAGLQLHAVESSSCHNIMKFNSKLKVVSSKWTLLHSEERLGTCKLAATGGCIFDLVCSS